ncbi:Dihydropteroate synthase [compost metagenome]
MADDLLESVSLARAAGVKEERIILDPGIGFAKDYNENLLVMRNLDRLMDLGYPLLLGTSRKKFIRTALDLPTEEVVFGTAATVALGIAQGCQIVRVHDVKEIKRTALMCDAIMYA